MGTRKLWTCWQGTLHWNSKLPLKYVGIGTYSFPRIGSAKRGSSADFCDEAMGLVWQETTSPVHRHRKNMWLADWLRECTRSVQVKLWYPLRTRAIPERLRSRQGAIQIHVYLYLYLYCTGSSFSQMLPHHFLPIAHVATRRTLPVCQQLSRMSRFFGDF